VESKSLNKNSNMFIPALVLSLFVFPQSSSAEYLGGKWNQKIVYYGITGGISSTYHSLMNTGMKKWNGIDSNVSYKNFTEVGISTPVDIWLRWYNGELGISIEYAENNGNYGWGIPQTEGGPFTYGNIYFVKLNFDKKDTDDRTNIVTHESGHTLGLAHTTKWFTSSIMDINDVFDVSGPTDYDKTNIKNLY
jgi:hypothetical protein